ncbi:ABC transporter ATP-binding protein [Caldalkalibacillus salinus]|uniref:ABC transporter ATP-binding protein n=1 Tax=Caldalkalibacillus salinus TaxID=2803787 RepID=UPI001920AA23|nr:ABC transporter ATP-binding protein [Caldalkalibacillus salinus]
MKETNKDPVGVSTKASVQETVKDSINENVNESAKASVSAKGSVKNTVKAPIIELQGLTKKYDERAVVNQLNLTIEKGEVFGLLGPNGAGKSTTILMMLGLSEPTHGVVKVCGLDATREPIQVKKRVGYLPDSVGFYEDRTGLENLIYTAMLNGQSRKTATDKASALLSQVGLEEAKDQKAGQYSRGMKQRLGLADVLIKAPEVIILDEPTLGIDPQGVQELLYLIRNLSQQQGITVLLSSHHLHQVQQICDRVGLFVEGKLLAQGNIQALSKQLLAREGITIEAQVSNVTEDLLASLRGLSKVMSVDIQADHTLLIKSEEDNAHEIASKIIQSGQSLHSLHTREHDLDDIYRLYFEGEGEVTHAAQSNL